MSELQYMVEPLFAEPVFSTNIGYAISKDQEAFIKNLKMVKNQVNLISENLYIFEQPELKSIKDAVHDALDAYASQVMGISQKLYVTQSWSLMNEQNIGMHGHSHSNSLVSGSLYFTDIPSPPANMIFDRHTTYQQFQLTPEPGQQNLFNTPLNKVTPKKHELVLFSSRLQHFVEANTSPEPRYSIAFNTFLKGKLGNYRDVSELTL